MLNNLETIKSSGVYDLHESVQYVYTSIINNKIAIINVCLETGVKVPKETKLFSFYGIKIKNYGRFPISRTESHLEVGWRDKNSVYIGYEVPATFGYKTCLLAFEIE